MNIPNVSAILSQKIAEIQARLPVMMDISSRIGAGSDSENGTDFDSSFGEALSEAANLAGTSAPIIDPALLSNVSSSSKTNYPLVSGSYESVYPRLSQAEIQEIMPRIEGAVETYAKQFGLDPELVRAVIKQESGFQPFALSTSGAMGLMQLMPNTAEGLGVTDPYNIEQNIKGGSQYLYYQLKAFNGDLRLALAAYNAGPNAVRQYGGIPPYEQTTNYVKNVMNNYAMYKAAGV